jgi:hypothetical protein
MNQTLCGSIRSRAAGAQPLQRVLVGLVVARAVDRPTADERSRTDGVERFMPVPSTRDGATTGSPDIERAFGGHDFAPHHAA